MQVCLIQSEEHTEIRAFQDNSLSSSNQHTRSNKESKTNLFRNCRQVASMNSSQLTIQEISIKKNSGTIQTEKKFYFMTKAHGGNQTNSRATFSTTQQRSKVSWKLRKRTKIRNNSRSSTRRLVQVSKKHRRRKKQFQTKYTRK